MHGKVSLTEQNWTDVETAFERASANHFLLFKVQGRWPCILYFALTPIHKLYITQKGAIASRDMYLQRPVFQQAA